MNSNIGSQKSSVLPRPVAQQISPVVPRPFVVTGHLETLPSRGGLQAVRRRTNTVKHGSSGDSRAKIIQDIRRAIGNFDASICAVRVSLAFVVHCNNWNA